MSVLPVLTTDEVRAIEARAARGPGPSLMERAGRSVAEAARGLSRDTGAPILVVAGPGNNGGDAWVAAALLAESFHRVVVFDAGGGKPKAVEAQSAQSVYKSRGGEIATAWPERLSPSLIVDGLLGVGLDRNVDGGLAQVIRDINARNAPRSEERRVGKECRL